MQRLIVAPHGGDFTRIGDAIASVPLHVPLEIFIRDGVYEEKIFCDRTHTHIIGESNTHTILRFADGAKQTHADGAQNGTFRSYTSFFDGETLLVRNMTIENAAGDSDLVGQSIAAAVHTAHAWFDGVRLLSCQDTLFVGPLPEKERQKDGFRGPRETAPRRPSRQLYTNCSIRGDIDFIFGSGDAVFDTCELECIDSGRLGYIAAPSTPREGMGFVFRHCRVQGTRAQSTYLARPWRPYCKASFLWCALGDVVCAAGFNNWDDAKNEETSDFAEYQNTGATQGRAFGRTLTNVDLINARADAQCDSVRHMTETMEKRSKTAMDIRYSANQKDFKRYTTEEIRDEFLIDNLYVPNEVVSVYSHVDRMVTLGCMPTNETVSIEAGMDVWKNFGTTYFLERRELGIFNVGGAGIVTADGKAYALGFEDCLYIARGTRKITFSSADQNEPARFYMVSAPSHKTCKTTFISINDANKRPCGAAETANLRVINQFIHPDVLETCQLSMGLTKLAQGSVWNTMPAHTHERRMEIYTYYNIPQDNAVFHMMGEGTQTRHIVMQNYQAVISPSWSIHSGCGTSNYTFIWAMGGENLAFDDMDAIPTQDLR